MYISVRLFNEGKNTLLAIMNEMGLKVGQNCQNEAQAQDENQIARAEASTSAASEDARNAASFIREASTDVGDADRNLLYSPGIDSDW